MELNGERKKLSRLIIPTFFFNINLLYVFRKLLSILFNLIILSPSRADGTFKALYSSSFQTNQWKKSYTYETRAGLSTDYKVYRTSQWGVKLNQ